MKTKQDFCKCLSWSFQNWRIRIRSKYAYDYGYWGPGSGSSNSNEQLIQWLRHLSINHDLATRSRSSSAQLFWDDTLGAKRDWTRIRMRSLWLFWGDAKLDLEVGVGENPSQVPNVLYRLRLHKRIDSTLRSIKNASTKRMVSRDRYVIVFQETQLLFNSTALILYKRRRN